MRRAVLLSLSVAAMIVFSGLGVVVPVLAYTPATTNWQVSRSSNSPACSPSGLCPSMLLTAYDASRMQAAGVTGAGQTVVIVDACNDPTIASDLSTFDAQFGLPDPTINVIYPQGTTSCSLALQQGWDVEISLDVEWSHVMAPSATIDLLLASVPSTQDLIGAWTYALQHGLGNQISNSWGGAGACTGATARDLAYANSHHVTVLASAGDSLAWGAGTHQQIQNPADCQTVLTVGGTTLNVGSSGNYISESAWGTSCVSGAGTGGGYVTGSPEPNYQSHAQINDPSGLLGKPDVSAVADPCTGTWVYDSQTSSQWPLAWGVIGGTSLSCPLWAGFMADVNQVRASHSLQPAGTIQPFLYNAIYGVGGTGPKYSVGFHDVTTGSNGFSAGTGWDAATGLGTFNVFPLAMGLGNSPHA